LNLKLCTKEYNETDLLHLIVVPQLSGGWQHIYSTKTWQAGRAHEQSMYSPMSMLGHLGQRGTDRIISIGKKQVRKAAI
jgi:hypothetical protein